MARAYGEHHFGGWWDGSKEESRMIAVNSDTTCTVFFEANSSGTSTLIVVSTNTDEVKVTGGGYHAVSIAVMLNAVANDGDISSSKAISVHSDTGHSAEFAAELS